MLRIRNESYCVRQQLQPVFTRACTSIADTVSERCGAECGFEPLLKLGLTGRKVSAVHAVVQCSFGILNICQFSGNDTIFAQVACSPGGTANFFRRGFYSR